MISNFITGALGRSGTPAPLITESIALYQPCAALQAALPSTPCYLAEQFARAERHSPYSSILAPFKFMVGRVSCMGNRMGSFQNSMTKGLNRV